MSESLNSRADSWQGSPSQRKINNPLPGTEGKSRRVNSLQMRNKLEFPRYVGDDLIEWLNLVAHYFKYYEVLEQEKVDMAAY